MKSTQADGGSKMKSRAKDGSTPNTAASATNTSSNENKARRNSDPLSSESSSQQQNHQRRPATKPQHQQQNMDSSMNTSVDSISRFPYQPQPQQQQSAQRQRSRPADNASIDNSLHVTALENDDPPHSAAIVPIPSSNSSLEEDEEYPNNNRNMMEMDESAASTVLMLQESTTFPLDDEEDEFGQEEQIQRQRQLQDRPTRQPQLPEQSACWNFAMEHRIFLKAVLELLAERDKVATEVGMNDPNVLKSGPLKKASHLMRGIWKVKYVEIRRGMFSYYEDAVSSDKNIDTTNKSGAISASATTGGDELTKQQSQKNLLSSSKSLLRKNIPLEANASTCRAVRLHQKAWNITPRGAIFELAVAGRPKRLWMANSREERQAWITAIHDAMVGGSLTRGGNTPKKQQHHGSSHHGVLNSHHPRGGTAGSGGNSDLKKYSKVQSQLKSSKDKDDYIIALRSIYRHELNVPVKWIIQHTEQEAKNYKDATSGSGASGGGVKGAFHEEDVKFGVDQLFKDLLRDTVEINGDVYRGNSGHAPERITGALARRIMLCGRRSYDEDNENNDETESNSDDDVPRKGSIYDMSESQALAYARDILLSGNRTRSGGDSYFCINALCKNSDLVVIVPSSSEAEPLSITITRDDDASEGGGNQDMHSKVGWLRTRRRSKNPWVKAYFVLSEGTLSFYEKALPRPHGLQGQIAISDATITLCREEQKASSASVNGANNLNKTNYFVLTIVAKDKSERQLLFESVERLLVWTYALECTAKTKGGTAPAPLMKALRTIIRMPRAVVTGAVSGATNHRPSVTNATVEGESVRTDGDATSSAEAALKEHVANLGLDFDVVEERLAAYANQTSAIVKVSIEAVTVYKICTLDPQGIEKEDIWAVVDATFLQEFRVSGGPNGRIIRGEELVRVDVTKCSPIPKSARKTPDRRRSSSPSSPNHRMQQLYRTFSDEVERRDK